MRLPPPLRSVRPLRRPTRRQVLAGGAVLLAGCEGATVAALDEPEDSGALLDSGDSGLLDSVDSGDAELFDIGDYREDAELFPTAVMAGIPEQTTVRLACVVADAAEVDVVVWDSLSRVVHRSAVTPSEHGAVMVDVEGLGAGTWYAYTFLRESARSVAARFRTAPADDELEPVSIAITACNGSYNDPWPILSAIAREDVELLLHLGDMAYNDGASDADEYRENWRWYLSGDGFREAFSRCALIATWDDHEVTNDWDPESVNPDRVALALESYFEHIPVYQTEDGTIWRTYRWGSSIEIFVLDCRNEREPDTRHSDDAIYISRAQMDWLKQALIDSPCTYKVVMNSVPITNMPPVWDLAESDRWEGYASQREELLFHLSAEGLDDVWFVSGDFHVCFAARIEPEMGGAAGRTWEIACSGGNTNPLGDYLEPLYPEQFDYGSSGARAVVLSFDPLAEEVTVRFLRADGETEHELVV